MRRGGDVLLLLLGWRECWSVRLAVRLAGPAFPSSCVAFSGLVARRGLASVAHSLGIGDALFRAVRLGGSK